jgi:hypothetical protein
MKIFPKTLISGLTLVCVTVIMAMNVQAYSQSAPNMQRPKACDAATMEQLVYLECQALFLWGESKYRRMEVDRIRAQAEASRMKCSAYKDPIDVASCGVHAFDLETEAGFMLQEVKDLAQKAEVLADEFWRIKDDIAGKRTSGLPKIEPKEL